MRVAFVAESPVNQLVEYCARIDYGVSLGHQVYAIGPGTLSSELSCDVADMSADSSRALWKLRYIWCVAKFARRKRIRIVVVEQMRGAALLAFIVRLSNLFSAHRTLLVFDLRTGSVNGRWTALKNFLTRCEASLFHQRWVISDVVSNAVFKSAHPVVGLGCSPRLPIYDDAKKGEIRSDLGFATDDLVVVYCGALSGRNVTSVLPEIALMSPKVKLLIMWTHGDSELEEIQRRAESLGLDERLVTLRQVPYERMVDYLGIADIGICTIGSHPGYDIQPPTKIYDYMAAGLWILATKTSAIESIFSEYGYSRFLWCESISEKSQELAQLVLNREGQAGVRPQEWGAVAKGAWDLLNVMDGGR